ncbi:glutamine synthetase [Boudabousia liubingyangii]|uniref:Glutamine synthetase n=1 Tax=Boudabousia liubingyangii TaxID=1921764 RepID=A0A1Q5PN94_9ACTO|nr:glutamine synthetase family protein [Boudabousia liubingyangii]OKL47594.1 glutamine synthetase [Boudabousia liubingyangii]OKL49018.1 glutamine synthetase [Boudabousia liubingyangii]
MNSVEEHVLERVHSRGIEFITLWFADVSGVLKGLSIAPEELEDAFNEGIGFDGSSIEGLTRIYESDMLLAPDARTFQEIPWENEHRVARMFCRVLGPDGQPAFRDPRGVLERQLERAAELGFTFHVHPEVEFYLLRSVASLSEEPEPLDRAGYFDHVSGGKAHAFRRRVVSALESMGISVEFSHHEGGPGQSEIDLRSAPALIAADNIMTLRTVVEELASREGITATFMPKPFVDEPGSGMHVHLSLFEGEENAFYSAGGQYQLSPTGRRFVAGVLAHAREISAITNQHVNSYKRLWGGGEAPSYVCWGHNNRSALIRVPLYKPGKSSSARVEFRGMDSAANPYLALAVILAAGLDGIEQKLDLTDETEDDVWALSDSERQALGIEALPTSLSSAVKEMGRSDLVPSVLGEEVFAYFQRNKVAEWAEYRRQITPFEYARFLSVNP